MREQLTQVQVLERKLKKIEDFKEVFGTDKGKKVLEDIMTDFKMYERTFDPDNQYLSAYNDGLRSGALIIRALVNQNTTEIHKRIKLLQEPPIESIHEVLNDGNF